MKNEIKVTKGQFERLIEQVHNDKYGKTLKEGQFTQGAVSSPGVGSAEGIHEIIKYMQNVWKTITDPKTKEAIKNFIASVSKGTPPQGGSPTREGKVAQKPALSNPKLVRKVATPVKK